MLKGAPVADPVSSGNLNLGADLLLHLGDERSQVATPHIGGDDHAALAVLAADLIGSFLDGDRRDLLQRHESCPTGAGHGNAQATDGVNVLPQGLRQANHDVEASVALEHLAGDDPADRGRHHLLDVVHADAEPRKRGPVGSDLEHRQAGDLLDRNVLGPLDAADHALDCVADFKQLVEIVAEHLDRHVRPDAGQQFVEPHLDRLGELVVISRDPGDGRLHFRQQFVPRLARVRPVLAILQHDEGVGDRWRHRIGGDLRRADLGHDPLDLRKPGDASLQGRLHLHGLAQRGAGNAQGMHGDVTFVQVRDELRPHPARAQGRDRDEGDCDGDEGHTQPQSHRQRRLVEPSGAAHDETVLLLDLAGDEHGDGGRNEDQRQNEGECQGHNDGDRHRVEHLPLHPGQGEDRHIDQGDDQHPEQ